MKIISYTNITDFKFWSGAKDNAALLTHSELSQLDDVLEELHPDGLEEVQLNDLLWFDFEWVCEALGLNIDEVESRD